MDAKSETRVFEMRTYDANPGKMKALQVRFRDHTTQLFAKHGMTIIGFWNPVDPKEAEEKLIYILAYPSREAAEKSWDAFRVDPVWQEAKAASEKGREPGEERGFGLPQSHGLLTHQVNSVQFSVFSNC